MNKARRRLIAGFAAGMLLVVGACSSETSEITIADSWARATPPGAESAAFYGVVTNLSGESDQLVGVSSPQCEMAQIHETTHSDGVAGMAPAGADLLSLNDGEKLTLEPGGLHVMCMGVSEPLVEGADVQVEFKFEKMGSVEFVLPVQAG